MTMKVAYVLPSLEDCGSNKIPFWLIQGLHGKIEAEVFYFNEKMNRKALKFDVPTHKIGFYRFCNALNNFDIVHSHVLQPDIYVSIYRSKIRAAKVTTIHGYHVNDFLYEKGLLFSIVFGNLWDIACKKLDLSVCITKEMEVYYNKIGLTNTITIPNAVSTSFDALSWQAPERNDHIHLSTVSSLNPRKGVEQILRLLQLSDRYYLTSVGGSSDEIERLCLIANQLGVLERCNFICYQTNPWDHVIHSDVFVFPSRSEGFGLALVEAAFLGIPIICSDIPTFREMFDNSEVTFFPLDNVEVLNQHLTNLSVVQKKAENAQKKAKQKFSIERMCDSYYKQYFNLLNQNSYAN